MATIHEEAGDLDAAMSETISNTLAEIRAREPEPEVAAAIVPDETPAEPVEVQEPEKPRDEKGKFAKTEKPKVTLKEAQAKQPIAETEPKTEPAEPPLKFGEVVVDLARAPSSWKPAAKAIWNTLPESIRTEVYRRETDFSNSVLNGPMKQNSDFGQAVKTVIDPYRMLIEAEGGTPEKAIADTMKTAALFRVGTPQQKLQAIFQIDQQYCQGALNQLFQSKLNEAISRATGQPVQPSQQPAQFQDPRVDQIMASLQQQERERVQQAETIANSATDQFLASKNEKGESLFPFVDNVLDDMTERVSILRRTNPAMPHNEILKQAYDAAVWANPETRAVLISQTQAGTTAAAQTAQKVATAKRAQTGTMPKRGAIPATEPAKSLDDSIRETGRELGMF